MRQSSYVFRLQLALFMGEKGMLIFYVLCATIIGVVPPFLLHSVDVSLTMAALLTAVFLKPILSDSIAGEREKKTLESLLSSTMSGKSILWGKFRFCLLFAEVFFVSAAACAGAANRLAGYETHLAVWQWICVIALSILGFAAISIAGVYASAMSVDSRTANSRVSRIAYPLGLLLIVYISVVFSAQPVPSLVTGMALMLIYLCISATYAVKALRMKQAEYFENVKSARPRKAHVGNVSSSAPKSQFKTVFLHELRYLLTLKSVLLNFLLLCFCPAILVCIMKYYTGEINLYYAVILTALMMPRAPANLIAYSIGGEKSYKTGESLLATPLRVRPLFLAKSMIPVIISVIMLAVSSLLTLAGANLIGYFFESGAVYRYTADQLMLLFPVGIMSCITMVFITGVLSVNMITPRQGLYVSSILGLLFAVPPPVIVYLTKNAFIWSMVYFAILLLVNAVCVRSISDKITRPQIISRL